MNHLFLSNENNLDKKEKYFYKKDIFVFNHKIEKIIYFADKIQQLNDEK
jgi:hypothetical protein